MAIIPTSRIDIPTVYVGARGLDASPEVQSSVRVQKLLAAKRKQLLVQEEAEAEEAVARRAITNQLASPGELSQTPEDLAARYQQVYEAKAETLYANQVIGEAAKVREDIAAENEFDSAGFAKGWNAYMHGQIEGLTNSRVSPDIIMQTRNALNEAGLARQAQIEEATAARAQRVAGLEFRQGMLDLRDTAGTHLYTKPDEEYLYNAMGVWEARVEDGVQTGYLTPLQGANMIRDGRQRMIGNFATGVFQQALSAGQVGRARGVVKSLRAGRWYSNMKKGRQLADALANQLDARMSAVQAARTDRAGQVLDHMERLLDVAEAGGGVSLSEQEEAIQFIEAYGSTEQKRDLVQTMNGIKVYTVNSDAVATMSVNQLDANRANLTDVYKAGGLSETTYDHAVSQIDKRSQQIAEAKQSGDIKSLVPTPLGASPEQRVEDAWLSAHIAGVDPKQVSLYEDDQLKSVSEQFDSAVNPEDRTAIASEFFQSVPEAYKGQVSRRLADRPIGPAIAFMRRDLESGQYLTTMAARGDTLPSAMSQQIDIEKNEVIDSQIRETAAIIAGGNPQLFDASYAYLVDAVRGSAANYLEQMEDPRNAVGEAWGDVSRRTDVYRQSSVTLTNGVEVLPSDMADTPTKARDRVDAANMALANNPAFAGVRGNPLAFAQVYPMVMPDGSLTFTSTINPNATLTDDEGDVIRIPASQVPKLADKWRKQENDETLWEKQAAAAGLMIPPSAVENTVITENLKTMDSGMGVLREAQFKTALDAVPDSDPALMAAIGQTVSIMPADLVETRNADTGLTIARMAQVAGSPDYRHAVGAALSPSGRGSAMTAAQAPLPGESRSATYVASSMVMTGLREKYGSLDEALVAYWIGPEVLDAIQEDFGADWEAQVPADAWGFAEEVKSIYAE